MFSIILLFTPFYTFRVHRNGIIYVLASGRVGFWYVCIKLDAYLNTCILLFDFQPSYNIHYCSIHWENAFDSSYSKKIQVFQTETEQNYSRNWQRYEFIIGVWLPLNAIY